MDEETLFDEVIYAKSQINLIASMSYEENLPISSLLKINNSIKNIIIEREKDIEKMKALEYKSEDEDENENKILEIVNNLFYEINRKIKRIFLDIMKYNLYPNRRHFQQIITDCKQLNHEKFIKEIEKGLKNTSSSILDILKNELITFNDEFIKRYSTNQKIRRKILKHCNNI